MQIDLIFEIKKHYSAKTLPYDKNYSRSCGAFTLIELLTVISIVAVLAALLLISLGPIMGSIRTTKSINNLKQISALHGIWISDHNGDMITEAPPNENGVATCWAIHFSVMTDLNSSVIGARNYDADKTIFASPFVETPQNLDGTPGYGWNCFLGVSTSTTSFDMRKLVSVEMPSQTIAFVETVPGNSPWTHIIGHPGVKDSPALREGKVLLSWIDGRVSREPESILTAKVRGISRYYMKRVKSN